jgi:hypothetical protein
LKACGTRWRTSSLQNSSAARINHHRFFHPPLCPVHRRWSGARDRDCWLRGSRSAINLGATAHVGAMTWNSRYIFAISRRDAPEL